MRTISEKIERAALRKAAGELDDVTIGSTGLFNGPGMMNWFKNAYETGDEGFAIAALASSLPSMPIGLALAYLEGLAPALVNEEGDRVTIIAPTNEEEA